jgi:signal transduction histidine kinase/phage shock protein PspC (stress-responsive transcriptional regulator)
MTPPQMCVARVRRDHLQVPAPNVLHGRALGRPVEGRMVAGVAAGVADALGLERNVVRCGFVVLAIASGLGVILYAAGWAFIPSAPAGTPRAAAPRGDALSNAAFGAVVLGGLLLVRAVGLWPGDVVVWPLAAALAGLALLAMRTTPNSTPAELPDWPFLERLPPDAADALAVLFGTRKGALARIAAGFACVLAGLVAFLVTVDSWRALRGTIVGIVAIVIGLALVVGPGFSRLANAFVAERRERIRADERAEVAAHLHDSVLQTLALVQRRADEPREVVRLARMQERELRAWLLSGDAPAAAASTSLGAALEELAASIESEHRVPVEVVRVRDCGVEGTETLLAAAREAILNAVRHSGAASVSVYLEVEPDRATIFVRDRGKGFDLDTIPADRGGVSNSIVGRMTRSGGRAVVHSTASEGTEVELVLPLTNVDQKKVDEEKVDEAKVDEPS